MIFLSFIVFSDKLAGLAVFFGVASAAGWVAMSFGRFYHVGDRVQLGGIQGDVIDIGVLRTTLMEVGGWIKGDQYNGRRVRVANSFIFKEPVCNYYSDLPFLWDEISVPVRYGSHYDMARQAFQQALEEVTGEHARRLRADWRHMTDSYMLEDARLEPMVMLSMKENWVEFGLVMWWTINSDTPPGIKFVCFCYRLLSNPMAKSNSAHPQLKWLPFRRWILTW